MPALKCPNPSCPFLFDPTQVPAGAVLTCPRCSMRFTLGPSPGASPPPPVPAPTQDADEVADTPTRHGRRREGFPILMTVGGVLLMFGLIAGAIYVALLAKRSGIHAERGPTSNEIVVAEKNFAYHFPGPPWVQDQETRNALNVHAFALKRAEPPEAWAALEVSDFGDQPPTEAELQARASDQLRRVFLNLPDELPLEPAKWAGRDAKKCQFRGERKGAGVVCSGECYFLAYRGIAYWFYTWSAEKDAVEVADQFADLRGRFRVLDGRQGDSTKPPETEVVFHGTTTNYKLSSPERIWKQPEGLAPTDENPKADLLLQAELPGRQKRDFPPRATLVVIVLKGGGDPAEAGGKYVRQRHTPDPEVFGPTKITEVTGDAKPPDGASVTQLRVTTGGANASRSAEKFVAYSAIKVGEDVVIAEGSCPWPERVLWESRLVRLVKHSDRGFNSARRGPGRHGRQFPHHRGRSPESGPGGGVVSTRPAGGTPPTRGAASGATGPNWNGETMFVGNGAAGGATVGAGWGGRAGTFVSSWTVGGGRVSPLARKISAFRRSSTWFTGRTGSRVSCTRRTSSIRNGQTTSAKKSSGG